MSYRTVVRINGRTWTADPADPADPADLSWLAGEAVWSWAAGGEVTPDQPEPVQCQVQLHAVEQLALQLGDAIECRLYVPELLPGYAVPVAQLQGRITELAATPATLPPAAPGGASRPGRVYAITAVDYVPDLAELYVGETPWPAEGINVRLGKIAAAAGIPGLGATDVSGAGASLPTAVVRARDVDAQTALDLVTGLTGQAPSPSLMGGPRARGGVGPTARGILAPYVPAGADAPTSWALDFLPRTGPDASFYPARFGAGPAGYGLTFDTADSGWQLDAGNVDRAATWTRRKDGQPNRAVVTGTYSTDTEPSSVTVDVAAAGRPPVTVQLETQLRDRDDAARMGLMYLPETDNADGWAVERFTFHADRDPGALAPAWFPRHDVVPTTALPVNRALCYARPVVVFGIDPQLTPNGRSFVAGQLVEVRMRLAAGSLAVEFAVRRTLPEPDTATALRVQDVPAGVRVDQLDPEPSVFDYRLVRR